MGKWNIIQFVGVVGCIESKEWNIALCKVWQVVMNQKWNITLCKGWQIVLNLESGILHCVLRGCKVVDNLKSGILHCVWGEVEGFLEFAEWNITVHSEGGGCHIWRLHRYDTLEVSDYLLY